MCIHISLAYSHFTLQIFLSTDEFQLSNIHFLHIWDSFSLHFFSKLWFLTRIPLELKQYLLQQCLVQMIFTFLLSLKSACDLVKDHMRGKKTIKKSHRKSHRKLSARELLKPHFEVIKYIIPSLLSEPLLNKQQKKSFVSVFSEEKKNLN